MHFEDAIWVETGRGGGGHDLNDLSIRALQLASLSAQKTSAYVKSPTVTSLLYGLGGWKETLRYEPEGAVPEAECRRWVSEARRLHDEVIAPMKLDGVIA